MVRQEKEKGSVTATVPSIATPHSNSHFGSFFFKGAGLPRTAVYTPEEQPYSVVCLPYAVHPPYGRWFWVGESTTHAVYVTTDHPPAVMLRRYGGHYRL